MTKLINLLNTLLDYLVGKAEETNDTEHWGI